MNHEKISDADENVVSKERLENARRVFHDFFEIKSGEKILFLTDNSQSTD